MGFPPEICLIGAQKCGTTSLAYILDQHPEISVARNKEPSFYTHHWNRGLGWYEDQFPEAASTICIDASPSFTEAPLRQSDTQNNYAGVPEKVASVNPKSRFIYLLRDPVERTYSGYWAAVRHGNEKRKFSDAMFDPAQRYLDTSDYYGQLELWLEHFPVDSFLFLLLDDFKKDPNDIVRRCFRFIDVDEKADVDTQTVQNRSYDVGAVGRVVNRLMLNYPGLIELKHLIPQSARDSMKRLKRGSRPIPKIEPEDRKALKEYFAEKNKQFENITGVTVASWQDP